MNNKKGAEALKIVVTDGSMLNPGDLSWEPIEKLGDLTVYDRTESQEGLISRLKEAEIALVNKSRMTREVIEASKQLKYIGVTATGVDNVDIKAATENDIIVTNVPAYGAVGVAQYVFALILEIANQVGHHSNAVKKGRWQNQSDFTFHDFPLFELQGKTMGIVGYGEIGREVERLADAFRMNILIYDHNSDQKETVFGAFATLSDVIENSDILTLHVPLTKKTKGMIGKEELNKMKRNAILINTARGDLVAEEDLANSLNNGDIYAAAVDVASKEPIEASNPLLEAKNIFITPHIAWAAHESRSRLMDTVIENLTAFINGDKLNAVEE